ncbi:MAG TPA: hypothetical protein ENK44_01510 [Caldithrix abyssi]|uniref:Uncharacterized protein n=1 Tax=Caldithrix abyssi TaxID=187145 RepID=A0A7V4TXN0_CALAY|nr:hypothetical protein [Caldithrix abyssi]
MSKSEGKGSILLKLIIVILVIGLILVIKIPGDIWEQEEQELLQARSNLTSIYESERFYFGIHQKFTTDPAELISTIRQDSTLLNKQKIVNNTRKLSFLIKDFLNIPYIEALRKIDENMKNIVEDLTTNRRNFKRIEDIFNEAEDLRMEVNALIASSEYPNYTFVSLYTDSMEILYRDLSDFTLQVAASRAKWLADTIYSAIDNVNISGLNDSWSPLSKRLEVFTKKVNRSELVNVTSVGDRIKDFRKRVDESFRKIKAMNFENELQKVQNSRMKLDEIYNQFLQDFIITTHYAQYRLSESDSLVLHLTEDNFYSPINGEMYIITIVDDSTGIRIESPVLLKELKEKAQTVAQKINSLNLLPKYKAYLDTLESIRQKGENIRKRLKRNTDIFIKYKEMEEVINRFDNIGVVTSYNDLTKFVDLANNSSSYGEIKSSIESGLNAVRIYKQAYEENIFGKLDTLHKEIINEMESFNELLSTVRRLPKDVRNFESDIQTLQALRQEISAINSPQLIEGLKALEADFVDLFFFASEGTTQTVYGVFSKKIINPGYIEKGVKSWEEEK